MQALALSQPECQPDGGEAVDLGTFELLRGPAGALLLSRLATEGPLDDAAALRLGTALRREHPADLVAAAITMSRLRERGRAKFGAAAEGMWFTPDGLEQATHPAVAAHRARRIAATVGGGAGVLDLCCGIGSDLLALGAAGLAPVGVDLDPLTAAVAAANTGAPVECADATTRDRPETGVFIDPARRAARGRVFDPAAYRPPWDFVLGLLGTHRCRGGEGGAGHPARPGAGRRRDRVGVVGRGGEGGRALRGGARERDAPTGHAAALGRDAVLGAARRRGGAAAGRAGRPMAARAGRRGDPGAPDRSGRRSGRWPPAGPDDRLREHGFAAVSPRLPGSSR